MTPGKFIPALAAATTAAATLFAPIAASAQSVEIGQLTCRQTDRTNLVFFSEAKFACVFDPVEGPNERYSGAVSKIGVDLSTSKVETMVWYVFAPADSARPGALEGSYGGASADAALGVGVGARVLVGGLDRSFALQPAAVSGSEGVGIAAGIEQFDLTFKVE
ncbi:MAG: DUF992 domain-containing protein [Pseudomonadota bacterium]